MLFMFNHISTIERDDDPYNSDYIIFLGCGSTTKQMWDCSHTKKWQVFLFVMLHDVAFSLLLNPSKTSIGWCVCVCVVGASSCRYGIFTYKTDQNCTPKVGEKFTGKPFPRPSDLPDALESHGSCSNNFRFLGALLL